MTWAKRLNRVFKIDIDGIFPATLQARRHDWLTLTGGAIGAGQPTPKTLSTLDLARPDLDFVALASGMGVPATRATTAEEFDAELAAAMSARGPRLIEAMVVQQMPRSQS